MTRSIESLKAFVAGSGAAFEPTPGVIVLGSGKGGTGTSLLAALLALAGAEAGARVLLVDADETTGTLHLLFGLPSGVPGVGALRSGGVAPEGLLVSPAPNVSLLPGGGGVEDATFSVAPAERRALLRRVAGLYPDFDLVVVDGGSRLDSVMAACAVGAERLLAVTTPDRIALAATYALIKVARARFDGMPLELLVNHASAEGARDVHAVVASASSAFLGSSITLAGAVPEDGALAETLARGESLAAAPPGPAQEALAALAARFSGPVSVGSGPGLPTR